jgi:hypothetical protein
VVARPIPLLHPVMMTTLLSKAAIVARYGSTELGAGFYVTE